MPEFDYDAALAEPVAPDDGIDWKGVEWSEWEDGYGVGDDYGGDYDPDTDDIGKAAEQGWGIFGDGWGTLQLRRAPDRLGRYQFATDNDAWRHVWSMRHRCPLCARALVYLRELSPREFERIRTTGTAYA